MMEWNDDAPGGGRWYCDGEPIHAGMGMLLRGILVRIESKDRGRVLIAFADVEGLLFHRTVASATGEHWAEDLRWP